MRVFRAARRCWVVAVAVQGRGARGLTDETPLGAMYAMARGARIYDGPDEGHRMVAARRIPKSCAAAARPGLGRPGRGAPRGGRAAHPEVVRRRRALALRVTRPAPRLRRTTTMVVVLGRPGGPGARAAGDGPAQ